jgi:SAM-dependent methyltransferase
MNWIVKASLQKSLSYLPMGNKVNYVLQRKVTKGLPVRDEEFFEKVLIANGHYDSFLEYSQPDDISNVAFYEFGAGWDLISPLVYYSLGIEHQTIVDIRPNIRFELINDTLSRLSTHKRRIEQIAGKSFRDMDSSPIGSIEELENRFGILYDAPLDARNTKLPAESYDFISNTSTLEHIPAPDIQKILVECRRLLKPKGIVSSIIDMKDHYSYFDANISCYNFLKFSDALWKVIDSPLQFQNRLRCSDYIKLFEQSGLEIIAQDVTKPTFTELEVLQQLSLSSRFQGKYSLEDLGVKVAKIVTRKCSALQWQAAKLTTHT